MPAERSETPPRGSALHRMSRGYRTRPRKDWSPFQASHLTPVFDAMLEKATSLCEAAFGILWTYDGERYHAAAFRNVPQAYAEFLREPAPLSPETPLGRIAAGELLAHIRDMAAHE